MNNSNNIEDIFRNTLENYKADVKPELWNAIKSKLPVQPAPGNVISGKDVVTGAKISSSALFISATIIVITAVSLVLFSNKDVKPLDTRPQVAQQVVEPPVQNAEIKTEPQLVTPSQNSQNQIKKDLKPEPARNAPANTTERKAQNAQATSEKHENSGTQTGQNSGAPVSQNGSTIPVNNSSNSGAGHNPEPNDIGKSEPNAPNSDVNEPNTDPQTIHVSKPVPVDISQYFGQIPNSFSPNGDGKNDMFMVHPKDVKSFSVTIFDRFGKQVHQWSNPNGFWDGLLNNGNEAPDGPYRFIITGETTDGQSLRKQGTLTIFRK